jgi:hypothetical protein
MKRLIFVLLLLLLLSMSSSAQADFTSKLNYQGRLCDSLGIPAADDIYSMVFKIYEGPASFAELWSSGELLVEVENGLFNVQLGPIPLSVFDTGSDLYLGIQVGAEPELVPRIQLTMAPYAAHSFYSDHAYGIADYTIKDIDIHSDAEIDPAKIEDTAAVVGLGRANYFHSVNYFDNFAYFDDLTYFTDWADPIAKTYFYDSTMRVNNIGIRIGDDEDPVGYTPLYIERNFNAGSPNSRYGLMSQGINAGTGMVSGIWAKAQRTSSSSTIKNTYGVYGYGANDHSVGYAIGVYGYATGGFETYGVYGVVGGDHPDEHAGLFIGDVAIQGAIYYIGGGSRLDHPLDPENKYLYHSMVASPDMKNIYDGNAITDENGRAIVMLPDYFEAYNSNYRYQLTVIGSFAQAIVEEEIENNRFVIATDEPNIKVSWQVTGIRNDPYAQDNRLAVEQDKRDRERGLYLYPEGYDKNETESIYYEAREQARIDALGNGGE